MHKRLDRNFFLQPTLKVAKQLIGKKLVYKDKIGIITETEAYIGQDDPACHASCGKTKRNEIMFNIGGFTYIYLIYGMYYCFNIVTEQNGFPAAVLIRAAYIEKEKILLNGPGKLCKYFNITKNQNGIDICTSNELYILNNNLKLKYKSTPRIGIKVGLDKKWRFVVDKINII